MTTSAVIAEAEVRIQCSMFSLRQDHLKGILPGKGGGEAPDRCSFMRLHLLSSSIVSIDAMVLPI